MMKLTKEECLEALNNFWEAQDENHSLYWSRSVLTQLIEQHFELECAYEMYKDIAIDQSKKVVFLNGGIEIVEKALDKACELLETSVTKKQFCVDRYGEFTLDVPIRTKEEWKEFLLND